MVSEEELGFRGGPLGDDRPGGKPVVWMRGTPVLLERKVRGGWETHRMSLEDALQLGLLWPLWPFVESPKGVILNMGVAGR